ncbi:MAG: putative hemolysin [Pirellulaceae bacterium]|jgi:putative hemolysin
MITACILFVTGLALSAFFSGAETGFYRVTRVRLVLDGLGGDWIARSLLWLTNNPTLFVATTLIGNNLANYLTSYSMVMGTLIVLGPDSYIAEMLVPIALAPIVFIYGELLPKNLFYSAPNFLLRRGGPLFIFFTVVFAPFSALLWGVGWLLERILGQAPLRVQLALARSELQKILDEGQEVGILQPAQRQLAQSLFAVATEPVSKFSKPVGRFPQVRQGSAKSDILRLARRQHKNVATVIDKKDRSLIGYVRIVDLYLDESETVTEVRPLMQIPAAESVIESLIKLQQSKEDLACIVDGQENVLGLLFADELIEQLLKGDVR